MYSIVQTRCGQLRGLRTNGAAAFKGVPYAAPPFGANRMRPPRPVDSWDGVRDALTFTRVLPDGFDVVFDGIAQDGYRRSFAALKRGGLLCAYGYSAGVQAQRRMLTMLMWIARLYLWRWLPGGNRALFYSINAMRARHPAWFREDMERLFGLLATQAIRPRVAERISFDEVAEAHRRLEAGGLEGKLVLCPDHPP